MKEKEEFQYGLPINKFLEVENIYHITNKDSKYVKEFGYFDITITKEDYTTLKGSGLKTKEYTSVYFDHDDMYVSPKRIYRVVKHYIAFIDNVEFF